MPIRPIDMQVLMPKSQNISKISQNMANKSENLLQQAYIRDKKKEKEKLKKISDVEKKGKSNIKNNDTNEGNKCIYNEEKKSKTNKKSKIDIRV